MPPRGPSAAKTKATDARHATTYLRVIPQNGLPTDVAAWIPGSREEARPGMTVLS